ncbi:hypothetical protein ASPSYDRAFT_52871, partial [Aspergillus sydowii CBS 593.65]
IDRSWFAIVLASIAAAVLVFSENSAAHSTPPCSEPSTRLEPDRAVSTSKTGAFQPTQ